MILEPSWPVPANTLIFNPNPDQCARNPKSQRLESDPFHSRDVNSAQCQPGPIGIGPPATFMGIRSAPAR